jgi:hypothetical protein
MRWMWFDPKRSASARRQRGAAQQVALPGPGGPGSAGPDTIRDLT